MLASFWQRLDAGVRLALPFVVTLLMTLLGVVTWPLPNFGEVAPPLALIAVYYWAIHRPDLFRPSMAFLVGLLNDVLHALPLGLSALVFVGMHQLVFSQRRFFAGHSFFMMWWGFALTALTVLLAEWGALSLVRWQVVPFMPVFLQGALAVVIFPLPCWLLIRLQRGVLSSG
ncbi:MAG: rod shape-determining protein MreD [Bdellovibrionales bacterium]